MQLCFPSGIFYRYKQTLAKRVELEMGQTLQAYNFLFYVELWVLPDVFVL